MLTCNAACLSKHVDDCNDQASQTDTSETVGQRATGSSSGDVLGRVVGTEVPGTVDSGDDDMNHVLEEFGDRIHRKRDEDEQTNNFGACTATSARGTGWIGAWFVFDIYSDESDREPSTERSRKDTTNERDNVDMSKLLRNVDARRLSVFSNCAF